MKYNLVNNEPLEINGDVYVKGVGTYDGTNAGESGVKTLKDILNSGVTEIIWSDLVDLRDNNELIPGQYYRITDYTCTTTTAGTKSAGHVFDIIVRADSGNKLNEEASAIQHTGDEYFADCDLNAWRLWYCLDNDTTRFKWADGTNGKGVIYRMIDEFGNDVPYDFKNIQFYRKWHENKQLWSTILSNNTGVPCYTFSSRGGSSVTSFTDMSLVSSNYVYSNVIKKYVNSKKQTLNNNCFFGNGCCSNTFGDNCYYNTFGDNCSNNTLGVDCCSNNFGNSSSGNTLGYACDNNIFGYYFYCNSFGSQCSNNSFRVSTSTTSALKGYVHYNHFDDGCSYNVIWNSDTTSSRVLLKNINVNRGVKGTYSSYNIINIDTLNSEQEINVNQVGGIVSIGSILSITYESLKTLRDSSKLIPGQQYRIIDYITTTSQENTKSAGHQFDIIVTALDECTLSEEAQAIQNINDSYFDNSNLSAWKLWYCLDNDTNRFAWAGDNVKVGEIEHKKYDSSKCTINPELINGNAFLTPFNFESCVWVDGNSDGFAYSDDHIHHDISELIYEWGYFTDENGVNQLCIYKSDAGYYEEDGQPDYGDKYLYRGVVNVDGSEYDYWQKWDATAGAGNGEGLDVQGTGDYVYATTQRIVSNPEAYSATIEIENIYQPGKGVIYRMIDEFNNDVPYDFKNIQFKHPKDTTTYPYYYYTFASDNVEDNTDISISISNNCYSNTIRECISNNKRLLNCIIFIGYDSQGYGTNCNTFGTNCYNNTFGKQCNYNYFGGRCYGNTFGDNCRSNTFGNYCYNNTLGDRCSRNTLGAYCYDNILGAGCSNNTFGQECENNIVGVYCCNNTFGHFCRMIKFASDRSASFKYAFYENNHFGNGCEYIIFTGAEIASEFDLVRNYNFANGLRGTDAAYLTIDGVRNRNFETKIEKDSNGNLKEYCLGDFIYNEDDYSYSYSTSFIGEI